jgi:hypothetical protein
MNANIFTNLEPSEGFFRSTDNLGSGVRVQLPCPDTYSKTLKEVRIAAMVLPKGLPEGEVQQLWEDLKSRRWDTLPQGWQPAKSRKNHHPNGIKAAAVAWNMDPPFEYAVKRSGRNNNYIDVDVYAVFGGQGPDLVLLVDSLYGAAQAGIMPRLTSPREAAAGPAAAAPHALPAATGGAARHWHAAPQLAPAPAGPSGSSGLMGHPLRSSAVAAAAAAAATAAAAAVAAAAAAAPPGYRGSGGYSDSPSGDPVGDDDEDYSQLAAILLSTP